MFMRYQGDSVGHLYMRAIEVWLAKMGWGADDTPISKSSDSDTGSDDSEDSEDSKTSYQVMAVKTTAMKTLRRNHRLGRQATP